MGRGTGDVEEAIRATALELMETTPLHRIRVTRLCAACGVNRSTFYDHFRDVYDVANTLERQLLRELDELSDVVREGQLAEDELRQRAALGARLSSAGLERCLGTAAS